MVLEFQCDSCDNKLRVADKFAGRRVKCPRCGQPTTIESKSARPPVPEQAQDQPEASDPVAPEDAARRRLLRLNIIVGVCFLLAYATLLTAIVLLFKKHWVIGSLLGGLSTAAFTTAWYYGRSLKAERKRQKQEEDQARARASRARIERALAGRHDGLDSGSEDGDEDAGRPVAIEATYWNEARRHNLAVFVVALLLVFLLLLLPEGKGLPVALVLVVCLALYICVRVWLEAETQKKQAQEAQLAAEERRQIESMVRRAEEEKQHAAEEKQRRAAEDKQRREDEKRLRQVLQNCLSENWSAPAGFSESDAIGRAALGSLGGVDEELAQELVRLMAIIYDQRNQRWLAAEGTNEWNDTRKIGKCLADNGGFARMLLVYHRMKFLRDGDDGCLQHVWDGVGKWLA